MLAMTLCASSMEIPKRRMMSALNAKRAVVSWYQVKTLRRICIMKAKRKVKARRIKRKPQKLCDPGVCDHCLYIGEGDFLCDCHPSAEYVVVMSDWEPTDLYMYCETSGN